MGFFQTLIKKSTPFAVSIYCDGDSVTQYGNNYTENFKSALESIVPNLTVTVTNVAVSGQSQAQMLADLPSQILANNPDIITISTSLNDPVQFNNGTLAGNIRSYINQTLAHVNPSGICPQLLVITDNLAGQLLASPSPRPYATQVAIKDVVLNTAKEYLDNPNIWIADVFKEYDDLGGAGNPDSVALFAKLLSDMVHPNLAGYVLHNNLINPILKNIIDKIRLYK